MHARIGIPNLTKLLNVLTVKDFLFERYSQHLFMSLTLKNTNISIYIYLIIPQSGYCSALARADWLQLARR